MVSWRLSGGDYTVTPKKASPEKVPARTAPGRLGVTAEPYRRALRAMTGTSARILQDISRFHQQFDDFRGHIEEDDETVTGRVQMLEKKCERYRQERDDEAQRANQEMQRAKALQVQVQRLEAEVAYQRRPQQQRPPPRANYK